MNSVQIYLLIDMGQKPRHCVQTAHVTSMYWVLDAESNGQADQMLTGSSY